MAMGKCSECGAPVQASAPSCPNCGTDFQAPPLTIIDQAHSGALTERYTRPAPGPGEAVCPNCGRLTDATKRFCAECGYDSHARQVGFISGQPQQSSAFGSGFSGCLGVGAAIVLVLIVLSLIGALAK